MSLGETTSERIGVLLGIYSDPLMRIGETDTEWKIGTFSLDKRQPLFRVGYGGGLTAESRFRKQWFDISEKSLSGWAMIFRSYDIGMNRDGPEEFFLGWVPPERESDVDLWIILLNEEVSKRLRGE